MANLFSGLWAKLTGAKPKPKTGEARVIDAKAYLEPAARTTQEWSPDLIRAAELTANNGSLRLAADLCESLILPDDRAGAVLDIRIDALLGSKLTFEPGVGRSKGRALKALEAEEDFLAAYPDDELRQLLKWGYLVGSSPGRSKWTYRKNRIVPILDFWNPRGLTFKWSTREWMMRVEVASQGTSGITQEVPVVAGDGDWILFTPYGTNRPWVNALWRQLARWCLLKHYAVRDIGLYGEVHGNPIKLVKVGAGSGELKAVDPKLRLSLAEDMRQLGRNSVLVMPAGFDFSLVEATAKTWDVYKAQVDMANVAIAVAILGQNMTTEPGANQNGVTGAREVRQDRLNSDAQVVSTTLHDQSLIHWASHNFGNPDLAPWPTWEVEAEENLLQSAQTFNTVGDAVNKLNDAGFAVDSEAIAERFKIPIKQDVVNTQAAQKLFEYHLKYGIVTINEARAKLGLEPIKGGDEKPEATPETTAATTPPAAKPGDKTGKDGKATPPAKDAKAKEAVEDSAERFFGKQLLTAMGIAAKASGFTDGQQYADDLADNARDEGTSALSPAVDALLVEIEAAKSYDDLRSRLVKLYEGTSADDMAAIVEKALILAELAGRHAVLVDV